MMEDWNIEKWLEESNLNEIKFSDYWNDEENEKDKQWYILDGDFSKMETYLQRAGLPEDFKSCVEMLYEQHDYKLSGRGIDIAAGALWAAPYILKYGDIEKLYCLEYSRHRLLKIGPKVLEHYGVDKKDVVLALGSFYEMKLDDQSLNFVFMSQAFHHADDPRRLLQEIHRVLKTNGIVIIIGEHVASYVLKLLNYWLKHVINLFVSKRIQLRLLGRVLKVHSKKFFPPMSELTVPDEILGDHYYSMKEYKSMFEDNGFSMEHIKNHDSHFQSFVLAKKDL